jgi:hypothetical protein
MARPAARSDRRTCERGVNDEPGQWLVTCLDRLRRLLLPVESFSLDEFGLQQLHE